mmetsp:Transcript_33045/g.40916  ORF Transcript_33045/g.40916 Transcript_33045/m.40916 type:complete len:175 (+) Transcript_33045:675-1199(+)
MEGNQVEVIRSLKTNGDGAQVTWSTELSSWVITSQNVSIVARNEKDVKTLYPEQTRYFLARKIALCWMKKVKSMGQARVDALTEDLSQYVFIGDFIGNKDLINLIKYGRETINFHSVMKKARSASTARQSLFSEANSFAILQKHAPALDVVANRVCGVYSSYSELCASLADIHK